MISVIITTYNRCSMLKEAIESVLSQSCVEIEILVMDDCSTDGTSEMMKNYPNIRYFRNNNNRGPGFNRKVGYNNSNGEYLVFMDDDNYYINNCFYKSAIQKFNEYPDLSFVSGNAHVKREPSQELIYSKLNVSGFINSNEYINEFQITKNKPYSTFTTMFRKKCLDDADLQNMKMVNDSSIYLRALLTGHSYILDEFIGVYRVHSNNISKGVSPQFLIKNLEEKEYILNHDRGKIANKNGWWKSQFSLTYKYFLKGNPIISDKREILKWGMKHLNGSPSLCLFIFRQYWGL